MQQINLYLPEFQPNREPLRSIHMLWGIVIFAVLLILLTVMSAQQNRQRAKAVTESRLQLDKLKSQVADLEQQRPKNNLAELDAQLLKATQEFNRREQIFQIISNKDLGNNSGFSAQLQALGQQSLDTVSLDAFSLEEGGYYVELAGKTRSVDQVPLYIQRLRSTTVFAQSAFGVLNAKPQKDNSGIFAFTLAKEIDQTEEEPKTAVQKLMELNAKVKSSTESRGDN